MTQVTFSVSVLLLPEGESWVAQGLEYDIAAQGETPSDATKAFERTFVGQIVLDIRHNRQPLSGFTQAPRKYWELFENGERFAERKPFYLPEGIPPAFMIAAAAEDFRLAKV